jgi:hypothetical protein
MTDQQLEQLARVFEGGLPGGRVLTPSEERVIVPDLTQVRDNLQERDLVRELRDARRIVGMLVHKLGGEAVLTPEDFEAVRGRVLRREPPLDLQQRITLRLTD